MQPDKRPSRRLNNRDRKNRKPFVLFAIALTAALGWAGFLRFGLPWLLPELPPVSAEVVENPSAADAPTAEPAYQTYNLDSATVHVVTIPAATRLSIAVADELTTVEDFAQTENASVVLNGGFFDPNNGKTTSHLIRQGQNAGDPAENERLVDNPDLSQYMEQILNRSEFRRYECQITGHIADPKYEITLHDTPVPDGCSLYSALGAGPQLLPEDTSFEEGFTDYVEGKLIRDAIGSQGPNARSAIALTADNTILLIMVAQRPDAPGLTLSEVSEFATSLGAVKLLNLDGGSSSALHYDGQTYLGRLDAAGNPIERPVKSVIVVEQE